MRKSVTNRTVERLIRAAYDFSDLAGRLKAEGFASEGASVEAASQELRDAANSLGDRLRA